MALKCSVIKSNRPCPITGSSEAYEVCNVDRNRKVLRNIISSKSGLVYVDPVPFENTEEFYKTDYRKSYKGVHQPKPKHVYRAGKVALERFSKVKNHLMPKANCLDAGSSSGEFVYLLSSRGFNAQGVEANLPYAEYSQAELALTVTKSPFSEFKTQEKFDAITMFHVLEHLEHPVRDLSHLGRFLKPGGKFFIEVPNILYPDMAFLHKWHPGHLFSFTDKTLALLLEKAGFKTVSCASIGDGGNLWGVFEKPKSPLESSTTVTKKLYANRVLEDLIKQRIGYYLRVFNFIKLFRKIPTMISEKKKSKGLSGKRILDLLYKDCHH
ncbi:MAG: class I SAM-dependent methyltransferase [Opitutales bacterium]|nr:class I SAM-dependent methyltransferase [Opitutales bacterium]